MASLNNGFNAIVHFEDVPGLPDRTLGIWRLKMLSASDTVTVPRLDTRSASNDQSSARVIKPATGVTVNAAAVSVGEHILTVAGSTEGQEVLMVTLHMKGRNNFLTIPNPNV